MKMLLMGLCLSVGALAQASDANPAQTAPAAPVKAKECTIVSLGGEWGSLEGTFAMWEGQEKLSSSMSLDRVIAFRAKKIQSGVCKMPKRVQGCYVFNRRDSYYNVMLDTTGTVESLDYNQAKALLDKMVGNKVCEIINDGYISNDPGFFFPGF